VTQANKNAGERGNKNVARGNKSASKRFNIFIP